MRFLDLHHHASYLDAESCRAHNAYRDAAEGFIAAARAAGAIRTLEPALVVALMWGASAGLTKFAHEGVLRFDEIDTTLSHSLRRELKIRGSEPLSAHYRLTQEYEMGRENWTIRIEINMAMRATAEDFVLQGEVKAFANGALARPPGA